MIRKVSGRIEFDVPEESRSGLNGIEGGSLEFSVEFGDVNGDQEIEAPAKARPLVGAHPVAGRQPACSAGWATRPRAAARRTDGGDGTGVAPVQPNGTGSAPNTPDAEDFKAYADCLDKARAGGHGRPPALQRSCCTARRAYGVGAGRARARCPSVGRSPCGAGPERPAVGALVALVVGGGALEQHRRRCCRPRRGSPRPPRRERRHGGTAASSARLASIGLASGPGSWMSVGATQPRRRGRGSRRRRAGASSARGDRRSAGSGRAARGPPRPSPPGGSRGGRPGRSSCPGRTSSWKSPP